MSRASEEVPEADGGNAADVVVPEGFDPADLIKKKPPNFVERLIEPIVNKMRKKKYENEKRMLRREEQMKQDVERILMEIEEQHTWVTLDEMNWRNLQRLRKEEAVDIVKRKEVARQKREETTLNIEQGLSYKLGSIEKFTRYQNSSSKYQDIQGHTQAVYSVKLSKCQNYMLSCGGDNTARLWNILEGKTKYPVLIYEGHGRKVLDADFHPNFEIESNKPYVITCSGDGTVKFWNTLRESALKTIDAHNEAIYKVKFSPDGTRLVTCSEDKTLKMWSYPEGYCLHVFRGHKSGVTCCNFSPSSKWIVSGSDYGERNILLWDASMPRFERPTQYPHQIFWTPEGLIRKILIRQKKPTPSFWLTGDQLQLLGEKAMVEAWAGEYEEIEVDSDSDNDEDDDDEDKVVEDQFGKDDVREFQGVSLQVLYTNKDGKTDAAVEYMPGGTLSLSIDASDVQISEAFISVTAKDTQLDMFVEDSGKRIGTFLVSFPLPWEMDRAKIDILGIRKPERVGDDIPEGLIEVDEEQALMYRNKEQVIDDDGVVIEEAMSKFGCVWFCPGPDMGEALVKMNFRFQKSDTWYTLSYSLKESPIRVQTAVSKDGNIEPIVNYSFDQEARHLAFFNYIREKNWDAVQSFIEKKAVMFKDKVMKKKRWRIMDQLENIFMDAKSVVIPTPIIFKGGQTKSSVMMEYQPYFMKKRPKEYSDSDSEDSDDDDEQESEGEGGDQLDKDSGNPDEDDEKGDDDEEDEKGDDDEDDEEGDEELDGIEEVNDEDYEEEEEKEEGMRTIDDNENVEGGDDSSTARMQVPELSLPGSQVHSNDGTLTPGSVVLTEPSVRTPRSGERVVTFAPESTESGASSSRNPEMSPEPEEVVNVSSTDVRSGEGTNAEEMNMTHNPVNEETDNMEGEDKKLTDANKDESGDTVHEEISSQSVLKQQLVEDDDDILVRPRTMRQHLREFVFAGEIEGGHFAQEVESLTKKEVQHLMLHKFEGVYSWKEIWRHPANPKMLEELLVVPGAPNWLSKVTLKSPPDYQSFSGRESYYDLLKHPMVKTTLFGPDVQKFSMPLPVNYPRKAGRAVNAFVLQLSQYEASKRKLTSERIPTSASELGIEEDEDESGQTPEFLNGDQLTMSQKRKNLIDTVRPHIAVNLMTERAYLATRRNCLPLLPGMEPHYPNPHYQEPAIEHPFSPMKKVERSFLSKLSTFMDTQVVSPVGRRKEYPDYYEDVEEYLREQSELDREAAAEALIAKSNQTEEDEGKEGEEKKVDTPRPESRAGTATGSRPGSTATDTRPSTKSSLNDAETGGEGLIGTTPRARTPEAREGHHNHKEEYEEDERDEEARDEFVVGEINLEETAAAMALKNLEESKEKELQRRKRLGIPADVYLGRRGSFCVAPGLEPFEDGAKMAPKHRSKSTNKKDKGNKSKKNSPSDEVQEDSAFIDLNERHGLIRRYTNLLGNEIVHQGSINDCIFAPSESRMASAGGDSLVKIWDPRDGTLVRTLKGHIGEVNAVRYSQDELYLVTAGADDIIIIWDMTSNLIFKRLMGHHDVITSLDISPDCTLMVSGSYDRVVKTWYLTPRVPGTPDPPRVISRSDKTALISWGAPPAFNLDITAFYIQHRIGLRNHWEPVPDIDPPITVMPSARSTTVKNLVAGTSYQFRIRAENLMGIGPWSAPSKVTKTEMGVPDQPEMPHLCGATIDTMTVYYFTPNPEAYGGASQLFEARYSGNGMVFEDSPIIEFNLQDAVVLGRKYLQYFRDKLEVKKVKIVQRKERLQMEKEWDSGFQIAKEFMEEIVRKSEEDDTHLFVCKTITGLEPGFEYRIAIRGTNEEEGAGEWSEGSYSFNTHPTLPCIPVSPFIEERTLTSIKFAWHAPDGRGTAITGYTVQIQHTGKEFNLPRSQQHYELDHLLPGKSYFIRVLSKNSVGQSEYSNWNTVEQSHTLTDKAEMPSRPHAKSGNWNTITLESKLPYNNGSPISGVKVVKRWVESFSKGEWEVPLSFSLKPLDPSIKIVELVDDDAFVKKLMLEEIEESSARKSGYNPNKKKKEKLSIAQRLEKEKPEGSKLEIAVSDLKSDTVYEFRVMYENYNGLSPPSEPSHRAKTNKAVPPSAPTVFIVTEVLELEKTWALAIEAGEVEEGFDFKPQGVILFKASFERHGGGRMTEFVMQVRNCTLDIRETEMGLDPSLSKSNAYVRFPLPEKTNKNRGYSNAKLKVKDLIPANTYQFRLRADNEGLGAGISEGIYSEWTDEIPIPELKTDDDDNNNSNGRNPLAGYKLEIEEEDEDEDPDDEEDAQDDFDLDLLNDELPTSRQGAEIAGAALPGEGAATKKDGARRGGVDFGDLNKMSSFG